MQESRDHNIATPQRKCHAMYIKGLHFNTRLLRITPGSSFRFHAVAHTCTCTLKYIVKKVVCAGNTGCNIQIIIPIIQIIIPIIPEIRYLERRRCFSIQSNIQNIQE